MPKLFKLSMLCAITAAFTAGCSTTTTTSSESAVSSNLTTTTTSKKVVDMHQVSAEGIGKKIGTISFQDSEQGLVITPALADLPAGTRGFHIHENASCAPAEKDGKAGAALAAGSHYNPNQAAHHGTPTDGHLGDLPVLVVDQAGVATTAVVAPRLKLADVQGHAIMIHEGGDNYSDDPKPLGGGGARIACGVIQ